VPKEMKYGILIYLRDQAGSGIKGLRAQVQGLNGALSKGFGGGAFGGFAKMFGGNAFGALEGLLGPQGSIHKWYTGAILLGCPWGRYEQGAVDGNVWQKHLSHLTPEFFQRLGYEVSTVGRPNTPDGAITAWRRAARPMQRA